MSRLSTLVWLCVIVTAALLLYKVKYEVQALRAQIDEVSDELAQEQQNLHVAAAEWAYLNRPPRLAALAARHLSADTVTADQIAEIEAIPFPRQSQASADDGEEGMQASPIRFDASDRHAP